MSNQETLIRISTPSLEQIEAELLATHDEFFIAFMGSCNEPELREQLIYEWADSILSLKESFQRTSMQQKLSASLKLKGKGIRLVK